jgi:hypothetical protein
MNIEVAVDSDSLTLYALEMLKDQEDPLDLLLNANKREIFALARACIQGSGEKTAVVAVPQRMAVAEIQQAREHVKGMFPEID